MTTTMTTTNTTNERVAGIMADVDRMLEAKQARNAMICDLATALVATGGGGIIDGIMDDLRGAAAETVAGWDLEAEHIEDAVEDRTFHLVRKMLDDALPARSAD